LEQWTVVWFFISLMYLTISSQTATKFLKMNMLLRHIQQD